MKYIPIIFILSIQLTTPNLLLKKSSVTLTNNSKNNASQTVNMLFDDRYLLDIKSNEFKEKIKYKGEEGFKGNLRDLAYRILKRSNGKKLKVKKVEIGGDVLKQLGGARALKKLNKYLNDKSFLLKYELRKRLKEDKKRELLLQSQKSKEIDEMTKDLKKLTKYNKNSKTHKRRLVSMPKTSSLTKSSKSDELGYLPKAGGIPFPPIAVNGVNYHAPMDITVNALPYPDPNKFKSPYRAAKEQLEAQS